MLLFTLIIVAELCLLFRLMLPDFLAFAEARFNEVYLESSRPEPTGDHTYSEWFAVPTTIQPRGD